MKRIYFDDSGHYKGGSGAIERRISALEERNRELEAHNSNLTFAVEHINVTVKERVSHYEKEASYFSRTNKRLNEYIGLLRAKVNELKNVTIKNKIEELSEKQAIIQKLEKKIVELTKPKCEHLHIEDTGWEIGPRQRCIDCGACLNTSSTPVFVNTKKDKE